MTQSDFQIWKFAGSLPQILVMSQDYDAILPGAIATGMNINSIGLPDTRFLMHQILYCTNDRVHGLLHYEGLTQLWFFGYKCKKCKQIFLVPSSVGDESELVAAMRHGCMEPPSRKGTCGESK